MYAIYYHGIFETGYVKLTFLKKSQQIKHKSVGEALNFATKFRVKWAARFFCWLLQKSDKSFREFKVIII